MTEAPTSDRVVTMTGEQIELLANELRVTIQQRTCCPEHASELLLMMMAGFALDDAGQNRHKAAAALRRAAKQLASQIETGKYTVVVRSTQ